MPDPDHPTRAEQRRDELALQAALRTVARGAERDPAAAADVEPLRGRRRSRPTQRWVRLAPAVVLLTSTTIWAWGDDADSAADPYRSPPSFTPGDGAYAFLHTDGSGEPIGFDPCRPIDYLVNPAGGPADWRELVRDGVAHVEWASGLDFREAGATTQRPFNPNQLDGALGQSPVVIGFSDETEMPGLGGDVAGVGGPIRGVGELGRPYYKGGSIALDTHYFDDTSSGVRREHFQAVVDHELGHLVGLGHVDAPGELMQETGSEGGFGPGDLEGLSILGSIPCR